MLLELAIRNVAIIRDLRLQLGPGLNALTGETGAGKSIIIDALGAVLGARVSSDIVRGGASSAWVEALFDVGDLYERPDVRALLDEHGIEPEDGALILARDINASGRNTARINGRAVTAGTLAALGGLLVDIHGQSEHLSLLRPALHLDLLDRFAGTLERRAEVAELVGEYQRVRREIDQILANERERAQRVDLLRFQVEEISAAALRPGEDEELDRERGVLANAERIRQLVADAYGLIEGGDETAAEPRPGALDNLRLAVERVAELARFDAGTEPMAAQIREALFTLEDAALSLRSYVDTIEANPARLAEVEDRIASIRGLKRKYGATLAEVIAYGERAAEELRELDTSEERVEELRARAESLRARIAARALALSDERRRAAADLEARVEQAIADLGMGRARFVVDLRDHPSGDTATIARHGADERVPFDASGIDRVEFLIAPNAGETPRPLARIASGGETARLMLALKSILSSVDATPTLVFDEIDVGVGGRSGQAVGEKLWSLSTDHQVIVISHLPQIAAFAESHYRIVKREQDGRTETRIDRLDDDERLDELAAMLDGLPVTDASRENARTMVARIERWKAATTARTAGAADPRAARAG